MESISLLFKVFWSPGEAMFKAAKSQKVLAPILLLVLGTVAYTVLTFSYINGGEIAIRTLEQRGQQLPPEQKARILEGANGALAHGAALVAGTIGIVLMLVIVSALFYGVFTFVGR